MKGFLFKGLGSNNLPDSQVFALRWMIIQYCMNFDTWDIPPKVKVSKPIIEHKGGLHDYGGTVTIGDKVYHFDVWKPKEGKVMCAIMRKGNVIKIPELQEIIDLLGLDTQHTESTLNKLVAKLKPRKG